MPSHALAGSRVLIVEDEYYIADDARAALADAGVEVLGPVATVAQARAQIEAGTKIDAVLLDLNLQGEMAFEVADALQSRGLPFAFVTGYDRAALPERFVDTMSVQKPVSPEKLVRVFETLATSKPNAST